ncbi:TonB-dependent receptor plug domain-containing protein [Thermodesulfobacteriota bacterium]
MWDLPRIFSFAVITLMCLAIFPTSVQADNSQKQLEMSDLLKMDFEELFEVEVSLATRSPLPINKAPAIAKVITADEIRASGARNLIDVLERVPGIGISRVFYSTYEIEVRGIRSIRSETVKLMVDGHSLNQPLWGGASWNYENISLDQVNRIEIIRGPGSALYGTGAFSGTINVVTKLGADVNETMISAGGGSFDTYRTNLAHGKQYGSVDVLTTLTYYETKGPNLFVESDGIGNSGKTDDWAEAWDAGLKVTWNDIIFNSRFLRRRNGPYVGVTNALNDESRLETDQFFLDLSFSRSVTEKWDINAKAYYDYFDLTFQWEVFPEGFAFAPIPAFTYPDGMLGTPHTKNKWYGFELASTYKLTPQNTITLGGGYEKAQNYDITHHANFDPNTLMNLGSYQNISSWANWSQLAEREIFSIFLQDEWEVINDVRLTLGVRYDHFSDFGDTNNPRFGLVWNPTQDVDLKLLYGRAFRAPSFDELYSDNNPAAIGNISLEAEVMQTWEMALGYRPIKRSGINLTAFHNNYKDKIDLVPTGTPGQLQFKNTGDMTVYGLETELTYRWSQIDIYANHTWQRPEDDTTRKRIANVPTYRVNFGLNMRIGKQVKGNINALFVGDRPRAEGDSRSAADAYERVDTTLIFMNFYQSLELRTSIYNVFDETYAYPAAANTLQNDYPTEGRSLFLEARYTF